MRYDDRLRTVLAQPAAHPHDRAIRWRQLVELLARGGDADPELINQGVTAVRSDAALVPESIRMAAARAIAPFPAPLQLISAFAADRLSVAAPVLAAARLTAAEWAEVSRVAAPDCRRFITSLEAQSAPAAPRDGSPRLAEGPGSEAVPSITEVLARIERLRKSREQPLSTAERQYEPKPEPVQEEPRLFRWECDETGQIDWVDGAPRGPLIGRSLTHSEGAERDERLDRAFSLRLPFREADLDLAEGTPVAGAWKISGVPAFEPSSGRFAGYRGVAEREGDAPKVSDQLVLPRDPDSLRDLAHEVKTPLNAIIGFAEMIGGEYLGPANEAYRQRAQEIVDQAKLLLAAIEDLDFAARQSVPSDLARMQADIGALVERVAAGGVNGAAIDLSTGPGITAAISPDVAERLIGRMYAVVVEQAQSGERLRFFAGEAAGKATVSISRPAALQGVSDEQLFRANGTPSQAGYWLRLTRSLARMVGADLVTSAWEITLIFPKA